MKGHQPRKRFGQNFLRDAGIIDRLADAINPQPGDHLVEIGPGLGALTEALLPSGCRLDAIELDRDLTTPLLAAFSVYPNFTLHSADALTFNFAELVTAPEQASGSASASGPAATGCPTAETTASAREPAAERERTQCLRIVGNLPYNISTPLIFRLLDYAGLVEDMHFMLQLEVVRRLTAQPGNKDWGRLGIMTQFRCAAELLFTVPPEAFDPPPKVHSAIVRLVPHRKAPFPDCDPEALARVVQAAFAQRRKTLRNNLKGLISVERLEEAGIDPACRAETLSLETFVRLAGMLP